MAIVPLFREGDWLKFIGIGISDYLDCLWQPGFEELLLSCIDGPAELRQLRRCSPFFSDDSGLDEPCPVLDLATVPKRITQNVHYYTRRAEREGSVCWEHTNYADLLEALFDLHTGSWQARGGTGVLADPNVRAFHRDVVPRLDRSGLLRMFGLRLNGRLIAVWYGFFHHRTLYFYLGGFSQDHQHLSPGTLLTAHAISCARAEGATRLDFLRGEESYKFLWGARSHPTYKRIIDRRHSPDWTGESRQAILW